ncbi:MAG: cytochrome c [Gemmataceae bacterium]|nr:cytochrome c [Gemmataceae bacterium]
MTKHIGGLALIAAIALSAHAAYRADDDDEKKKVKEAQKAIVDLAEALEAGKDPKDAVAAIRKKYDDLLTVMHVYKTREKGGYGVGPKGKSDGIELKIVDMGKRAPSKATLDKYKDEYVKMGYLNLAMGKIAHAYPPAKPVKGKGAKEWKQHSDDQEKASKELIEAFKKGDGAAVKRAATNLNAACNNCHSDFRDIS